MTTPLVSILIPTYNRRALVAEAITSALAQDYQNIEILIHDNHSSDGTREYLKKFQKDKRIRLFLAPYNRGMLGAWNYLMRRARGKYLKFIASDDLLAPSAVSTLVGLLESNPTSVLATCRRRFAYNNSTRVKLVGMAKRNTAFPGRLLAHTYLTSLRINSIGEPTAVLFRRAAAKRIGGFDPQFSQLADLEYWLRLLEFGEAIYCHKTLCTFRLHNESSTSAAIKDGRFITETFELIKKYYYNPHYCTVFGLTRTDKQRVVRLRSLDFAKNIKDLTLEHSYKSALYYSARLACGLLRLSISPT